jgi:hypothetical protein
MSTDSSQVGVALFPSCEYIFYHFTFPGFSFILIFRRLKHIKETTTLSTLDKNSPTKSLFIILGYTIKLTKSLITQHSTNTAEQIN